MSLQKYVMRKKLGMLSDTSFKKRHQTHQSLHQPQPPVQHRKHRREDR